MHCTQTADLALVTGATVVVNEHGTHGLRLVSVLAHVFCPLPCYVSCILRMSRRPPDTSKQLLDLLVLHITVNCCWTGYGTPHYWKRSCSEPAIIQPERTARGAAQNTFKTR